MTGCPLRYRLLFLFFITCFFSGYSQLLTRENVYDMEVGDVFHFKQDHGIYGPGDEKEIKETFITDTVESVIQNSSEIIISYSRGEYHAYSDSSSFYSFSDTIHNPEATFTRFEDSTYIDTIYVDELYSRFFEVKNSVSHDSISLRTINSEYKHLLNSGSIPIPDTIRYYMEGCGLLDYKTGGYVGAGISLVYSTTLVFYQKGNEIWGEALENPSGISSPIFPGKFNWNNRQLVIELAGDFNLSIINLSGQTVFHQTYSNLVNEHLNQLKSGIYFIEIHSNQETWIKKLHLF